jgi:ABC-type phosphate/phosphonate transport system permease subunit
MSLKRNLLKHPLSPISIRGLYAVVAIAAVMTIGTVGTKLLTGWAWIDSFYFMSMVATAQGPPNSPPNFWSKIFIAIMAFVSIGTLITAIGTLFGPFLGYLLHKGVRYAEKQEAENSDDDLRAAN